MGLGTLYEKAPVVDVVGTALPLRAKAGPVVGGVEIEVNLPMLAPFWDKMAFKGEVGKSVS